MRRHGAKQGNRMDYRMARHAAARHTGMRSVRRIAAAALGLALSLAGLSAQSVAFGNDDPTNPAATDVTMIAFQQSWKTIGDECTKTYGPEGVKYVQVSRRRNPSKARNGGPSTSRSATNSTRVSVRKTSSKP